jgi:hypothetical protein
MRLKMVFNAIWLPDMNENGFQRHLASRIWMKMVFNAI